MYSKLGLWLVMLGLLLLRTSGTAQECPPVYHWTGENPGDGFGSEISTGIGDFNNDGFPDVAVSTHDYNNYSGRIYIYSGQNGELLCTIDGLYESDYVGALCGIGDRNDDGFDDFVYGASGLANGKPGKAYIMHGSAGPFPLPLTANDAADSVVGGVIGDNLGLYGGRLPDINEDGYDDFAVGVHYLDVVGIPAVLILSGKTLDTLFTLSTGAYGDGFGAEIVSAGDVNGDGTGDIIVGAPLLSGNRGAAYLYSGADGSLLTVYLNANINDYFGLAVAGAGDVNADGFDDVVIGNPANDANGFASGQGCVFAGKAGPYPDTVWSHEADWIFMGNPDDRLGRAVCGVGDVNGDGKDDIALGAFQYYTGEVGEVSVFSVEDSVLLHKFYGQTPHGAFGISVERAGDISGDGITELLVGAVYRWDGVGDPRGPGEAFLFDMSMADTDGDGVYDYCDACPGHDDLADVDTDGVPDGCDNCPEVSNPNQEDINGNTIGDACESCCGFWTGGYTGNANCSDDGLLTLSDITRLIDFVFVSKEPLCCEGNGNTNGSEDLKITLADISRLIDRVFISKNATESCL